jgi:hypothetical protein
MYGTIGQMGNSFVTSEIGAGWPFRIEYIVGYY